VRELLRRIDALGLTHPTGGHLTFTITGPDRRLLAVATPDELEAAARTGQGIEPPPATTAYRPTAAQYRYLRARDRHCRFPGCRHTALHTDADHVSPYDHRNPTHGGRTCIRNLVLLCRRHHRLKTHAPGWAFALDPDGTLHVTTPGGTTRSTRPPATDEVLDLHHPTPPPHAATPRRSGRPATVLTPSVEVARPAHLPLTADMADRLAAARAQWRELLPTAYLLTGDRAAAEQLVVRTLARRRPLRGTTGPDDAHRAAVDALVRTHRRRRLGAGAGRITGDEPTPWWADPAELTAAREVADRLDELGRDERTAVVLRWHAGWTPDAVRALLPAVDLDALAHGLGPDLERRLDTLAGLCDTAALDDDAVVAEVRRTAGRRTRRALSGVAVAAALVAAAVWLPTVVPAPAAPASPTSGGASRSTEPVPPRGIYALPPRGALAGVADLLAQLQDRLDAQGLPGDEYRLVFGDDVDGVRALLAARPVGAGVDAAWLTGPAGADPADLQVAQVDTAGLTGSEAAAVTVPRPDGAGFVLVSLTQAGTTVRLSPGIDVDPATGAADRTFTDVPQVDGVATAVLDRSSDTAVQLQLQLDGSGLAVQLTPASDDGYSSAPGTRGPPMPSRSGAATASGEVVRAAVDTIAQATGWAEQDLDVSVLGAGVLDSGVLPGPDGHPAEVAAVAAVLPTGAVVTTTVAVSTWTEDDGSTVSTAWTVCGSSAHPAGTDVATLVVAATCTFQGSTGTTTRVAVVAAPPGRRVQLDFADGSAPLEPVLTDGFGLVPDLPARGLATATDGVAVVPVAGPGRDVLTG
jgi:hypothetical protein